MSLFDGVGEIIDKQLGIDETWGGTPPRYRHSSALLRMKKDNLPNGGRLVSSLFGQMMKNWGESGCPVASSGQNWRFSKQINFQDVPRAPEVPLERTITAVTDDSWANHIPVNSGLLGDPAKCLDLACRADDIVELIELRVIAATPLSAAIEILSYGLANAFFRINRHRILPATSPGELLVAKELHLRVLAPLTYYERFAEVAHWLNAFESCLDQGVKIFSAKCRNPDYVKISEFRFQVFPASFTWDQTLHFDVSHRRELVNAVELRRCLFA